MEDLGSLSLRGAGNVKESHLQVLCSDLFYGGRQQGCIVWSLAAVFAVQWIMGASPADWILQGDPRRSWGRRRCCPHLLSCCSVCSLVLVACALAW